MGGYSTQWGQALLQKLGAPVTAQNMMFLAAWAQAEGGSASFNPFNTTEYASGASNYNSVGVKNYQTAQQGLDATYKTLTNGLYGPIIAALRQGNSAMAAAQAEATTKWGTGALIEKVLGGKVNTPPATSSGPGAGGVTTADVSTGSPTAGATAYVVNDAGYTTENAGFGLNPLSWPGEFAKEAGKATGNVVADAISALAPALELPLEAGLQGALFDVMKPVFTFIWAGAEIVLGFWLMFAGAVILARKTEIGRNVTDAGAMVIPGVGEEVGAAKAFDASGAGASARLSKGSGGKAITWSSPARRAQNDADSQGYDQRQDELAARRRARTPKGANVTTKDVPAPRARTRSSKAAPPTAPPKAAGVAKLAEAAPEAIPF